MLVPNMLLGMDKQDKAVLHKLHLIITAGKYVYDEHRAVHSDVIARIKAMSLSYEVGHHAKFIQLMHGYAHLLGKVAKLYQEDTPLATRDARLITALNTCHLDCVRWAMALSEGKKIYAESCPQLMEVFKRKQEEANKHLRQAEVIQDAFSSCQNLTASLPREQAITAWYITFPPIMQDDTEQKEMLNC